MADPLDNLGLNLPYDYSKGEAPGQRPASASAPAPVVSTVPAAATPDISHPELDNLPVPYKQGEQPAQTTTAAQPTVQDNMVSRMSNWFIGANDPRDPVTGLHNTPADTLQPRSLSQTGSDIADFGRVAGNRVIVPNTLDRAISLFPGAGDIDYQKAQTAKARENIGPVASGIADFMGQRASFARNAGPIAQGVVTGTVGTPMGGDWNPLHIAGNTAIDVVGNEVAQGAGTFASSAAKLADRTARAVSDEAFLAGQGAKARTLAALHTLRQQGGDVAAAAEQYANTATGAAGKAYENIAEAARQSIDPTSTQRAISAGIGNFVPGVGSLASAYVLDPTMKMINKASRDVNVRGAIDQAYPAVANVVKSSVDPQAWRTAFGNLALSNAPDFNTIKNKLAPASWASWLHPSL